MGDFWTERGPSDPLSEEKSNEFESKQSEKFEQFIDLTKETRSESQLRERVLGWLDAMVKTFVTDEGVKQGYRLEDAKLFGGRIYSFGSYRLGVHGPGADIDTLVLMPRHVTRDIFFTSFTAELSKHSRITEMVPVPDAAVPVIKLKVSGLSIDLLFASLDLPSIPNTFEITKDEILKGIDDKTQKSLNGVRVATKMLSCVPQVMIFRSVLRGIKKWAQARGVYGNIYGYPGGVAWAIMVARVCQLYPCMQAGSVFMRFFTFHRGWWKVPDSTTGQVTNNPIHLTKTLDVDPTHDYGFRVWNKIVNYADRRDIFPIITPMYPCMNACYNCTATTLRVIVNEISRADDIFQKCQKENGSIDFEKVWEPTDFFSSYNTYMHITAGAKNPDEGRKWAGFVESRVRRLLAQLELVPKLTVHLLPREFCIETPEDKKQGITFNWFLGLQTDENQKDISLGQAWKVYMSYITGPGNTTFPKTADMYEPTLAIIKRRDLEKTVPFVLTESDKENIAKALIAQKKERKLSKRKRKEAEETPDLKREKSEMTNNSPLSMGSPLQQPGSSPAVRPMAPPSFSEKNLNPVCVHNSIEMVEV